MTGIRRQLTLFVSGQNKSIERIRAEFNPEQYHLIATHITLCREDEIGSMEQIIGNLNAIALKEPIRIELDAITRFSNGKGVLIPGKGENRSFRNLRKLILGTEFIKDHHPHITLMHPRNSICTHKIFQEIRQTEFPSELHFDKIALIEQENGGKWTVLQEFQITK